MMNRASLAGVSIGDGLDVAVMAALNVSPESFYPGSVAQGGYQLLRAAEGMVEAGAALLDVGAMSTAPYRRTAVAAAEEADRLADLIENLLDASRLQAGALKLNRAEVLLDQLAARLVEKFKTQTEKHVLSAEFPPGFPPVMGDEERLRQVLSNLLSNALKYSPGGKVVVRGRVEPQQVVVSVSDEGPGIAAADLPRVFDRFYRADSDLTKRAKGAGLGLYLAKAVVEAHGGRIWAESPPGKGTTFSFSLPR